MLPNYFSRRKFVQKSLNFLPSSFPLKGGEARSSSRQIFHRTVISSSGRTEQRQRGACHQQEPAVTSLNSGNHRKRVVFCEQVSIYYTISREDILPVEQAAAWFSALELQTIAQSCCLQIQKLNRGKRLTEKEYCGRGLESDTKSGLRTKLRNRQLAQNIVLEEQDRQRREGVREPEYLAYLYHSATSSCQVWANVVGLSDQRAAEDVMDTVFVVKCSRPSSAGWSWQWLTKSLQPSLLSRTIEMARAAWERAKNVAI